MSEDDHIFRRIRKCVTFIFAKQGNEYKPLGTGFLVNKKVGKSGFSYLVTANHVLESAPEVYHETIYLRLNKKDGKADFLEIPLGQLIKEEELHVHRHSEKTVDIATFLCSPPMEEYDFMPIAAEPYLITDEIIQKRAIAEGDDVFFVGLFTHRFGEERNEPIMRFGKVSLMTTGKTKVQLKGREAYHTHVYLFECQSLGAFSGAPVFYLLSPFRYNKLDQDGYAGQVLYLAGVMMGHYNDLRVEKDDSVIREMHEGIALITPCQYLYEIMESEAVKTELNRWASHHGIL